MQSSLPQAFSPAASLIPGREFAAASRVANRFFMPRTKSRPKKTDAPGAHEPCLEKEVKHDKEPPPRRLSDLLSEALRVFEQKRIDDEAFRSTLAEYLKLLQVERDSQLETDKTTVKCVVLARESRET